MPVIVEGATYALDPDLREAEALAYWLGADRTIFVAEEEGAVLGAYYLRSNQGGGGRHVLQLRVYTGAAATGRGVARRMAEHSLEFAHKRGIGRCSSTSSSAPTNALWCSGDH